jgi:hypothetical protein
MCQVQCATVDGVPAACAIGRSTPGTHGYWRTARYPGSPADRQTDPLRKPTFQAAGRGFESCRAREPGRSEGGGREPE